MVKKRGVKGSSWWSDAGGTLDGKTELHGVDVQFVCESVPVLTLDTSSIFHEHVSMMLQSALSSSVRADSLYEYCEDEDILVECRRLGYRNEDLMLAHVKRQDLRKVRAVGTTGKRSVMLAIVVGLSLRKADAGLQEMWDMLRSYELSASFAEVLQFCEAARSKLLRQQSNGPAGVATKSERQGARRARSADWLDSSYGVDLNVIGEHTPVIGLEKVSLFQQSASWLLQTALLSEFKADALYEYCNDDEILAECCQLGFSKDEVSIARLTHADMKTVKAVGTTGKRSTMLSLVVALVLHDKIQVEYMMRAVRDYDSSLREPFLAVVHSAVECGCGQDMLAPVPVAKRSRRTVLDVPPQELHARQQRLQRFEAATATVAAAREYEDEEVTKAASTDEKPLEGLNTDLEKPYFRITTLPRASDVRPVHVLRDAFKLVQKRWEEERDWVHTSEMLRSIRQDLTVQMVRGDFAVEVYEFGARAALELGDLKQFDLCSTQLEGLHAEEGSSAVPEFLAYRLLYFTLTEERLALSAFLRRHVQRLRTCATSGEPHLAFAWGMRDAMEKGSIPKVCKLMKGACCSKGCDAMRRLSSVLLDGLRLRQLVAVCKAYKPRVSRALLLHALSCETPADIQSFGGLPVIFNRNDPDTVDSAATVAQAEQLLSASGARRFGEQSSDHMRVFVRACSA